MRTLIFALSTSKCGTRALATALRDIGLESFHQKVAIHRLIHTWTAGLFQPDDDLAARIARFQDPVAEILMPHLNGSGFFCDISHYLAWFYPVIDSLDISTRSIHITRDARRMVTEHLLLSNIGIRHAWRDGGHLYPPTLWQLRSEPMHQTSFGMFEHWCCYWIALNEFFSEGKRQHFRLEGFNQQHKEILQELYPEASVEQESIFAESLSSSIDPYRPRFLGWRTWPEIERKRYNSLCEVSLRQYGYSTL